MKKIVIVIAIIVVLGVIAVLAYPKLSGQAAKPDSGATPVSAICPVMGDEIPDITKASGSSVYKGKTYYFCCPACKPQFDKDPEKYVGGK